jgi:predicted RNase H-like HicB family nuclease
MQIVIERNDDGYLASCASKKEVFAEGDTEFEALYNLFDVMRMVDDFKKKRKKKGQVLQEPLRFTIPIAA